MTNSKDNFKRGTAELLVLHMLEEDDLYGYQMTHALAEKSEGEYTMLEGTLYSILFRMSEEGYVSDYVKVVGKKRRRRYYHLEDKGRKYCAELQRDYDSIAKSIASILGRDELANMFDSYLK